jgi:hypothetical protein
MRLKTSLLLLQQDQELEAAGPGPHKLFISLAILLVI